MAQQLMYLYRLERYNMLLKYGKCMYVVKIKKDDKC